MKRKRAIDRGFKLIIKDKLAWRRWLSTTSTGQPRDLRQFGLEPIEQTLRQRKR